MSSPRASIRISIHSSLILAIAGCSGTSNESSTGPGTDVGGTSTDVGGAGSPSGGSPFAGGTTGMSTGVNPAGGSGNSTSATGGFAATGGFFQATGGAKASGGAPATGGVKALGGTPATGGLAPTGGNPAAGGSKGSGGAAPTGGAAATGGAATSGGTSSKATGTGGNASGGGKATGGMAATGGSVAATGGATSQGSCSFTVTSSVSSKIGTVGLVDWSTTLANVSSAQIVYTLDNAASSILNKGGTAPVDLTKANYHTLLLGLKASSTYTFHIEATASNGATCKSSDYSLKTTTLPTSQPVPTLTRTASNASAQAKGFIVTSGGINSGGGSINAPAYIIDADGAVVWAAAAPSSCSRARMDYEGANMWMLSLNVQNTGGEMRYVSMDGVTSMNNVSGLSKTHHDFTVLKGGIVASMAWSSTGTDVQSDLLERSPDGTVKTAFHIGSNLYVGGQSVLGAGSNTYHCNSILYHAADDTYTIGDRNPNMYVKVTHAGQPVWQFGGSCTNAPAPKCASGNWNANHGHHLLDSGNILFFNNGAFGSTAASHAFEYSLNTSASTMTAALVKDFTSGSTNSGVLGDVQRLPNGNTLVTFSTAGQIVEVDSSWNVVQTLKSSTNTFGYADWRETLYGPPPR